MEPDWVSPFLHTLDGLMVDAIRSGNEDLLAVFQPFQVSLCEVLGDQGALPDSFEGAAFGWIDHDDA